MAVAQLVEWSLPSTENAVIGKFHLLYTVLKLHPKSENKYRKRGREWPDLKELKRRKQILVKFSHITYRC